MNAPSIVVVIGRNNVEKRSASIEALLSEVHKEGLTVCWYERRGARNARLREAALDTAGRAWLHSFATRHPFAGVLAVKASRLYFEIKYPKRRHHIFGKLISTSDALEDFRLFVRTLSARDVFVVSHSAGGITASLAASETAVKKLICFGYPFKHPEKPDESYRTAHLSDIRKPFLIIQGNEDEYGTAQDASRYNLSSQILVSAVESDHDYEMLEKGSFDDALHLTLAFLRS